MTKKPLFVGARIEEKQAEWFKKRMSENQKSVSELVRDIISDRILFEENPWGACGKITIEKNARKAQIQTVQGDLKT
jgi:hypothetical protein